MWTKLLCLLGLFYLSDCVTVKVGDHTFSLKTVKEYKEILEKSHVVNDHVADHTEDLLICQNKELPKELKELCKGKDTNEIMKTFGALERICGSMDECEVCANVACTGCL